MVVDRNDDVYEQFQLYTRNGAEKIGITVTIPQFTPKAEVLQWGQRTFVWNADFNRYEEAFSYFVLPQQSFRT